MILARLRSRLRLSPASKPLPSRWFRPSLEALEERCLLSNFMVFNTGDNAGVDPAPGAGTGTLRQAIVDADNDATPGTDTITFAPGVTGTITLSSVLKVSRDLTITGPGGSGVKLDGNLGTRLLDVTGGNVTLSELTLTRGKATGSQGGGAVLLEQGSLTLVNCVLSSNQSPTGNGGAIAGVSPGGSISLTGCQVTGNTAAANGGGLDTPGDPVTVTGCNFSGNSANSGGALSIGGGPTVTISGSGFSGNSATTQGGAINSNTSATFNISSSTFTGNTSSAGGAIATTSTLTLSNCILTNNTANAGTSSGQGGAIFSGTTPQPFAFNNFTLTLTGCTLSGNTASADGGAIHCDGGSSLSLGDSTLSGNTAGSGGAVEFSGPIAAIASCTIFSNTATAQGGGLDMGPVDSLSLIDSTLSGNTAGSGGALALSSASATITFCTIFGNTATTQGGGLNVVLGETSPVLILDDSIVAGNMPDDVSGPVDSSSAYNLVGTSSGLSGISNGDANHNQVGAPGSPIDPKLGPLQDNGGPTPTRALLAGSPALGKGDPAQAGTQDQRGVIRPNPPDIGAFQTAASQLVFGQQPTNTTAGTPISPAVTVQVEDPFGHLVPSAGSTVTLTLSSGSFEGGSSTVTVPVLNGVATFANLRIDTAGSYTLSATDGALTSSGPSDSFLISPAEASKLVIATPPSTTATAGQAFAAQPVILVEDAFGNVETDDNSTQVTADLRDGTGPLQGTTTITVSGGVAAFTDLADNRAETISLDFSSPDLSDAVSTSVVVHPAATSQFVLEGFPDAVIVGEPNDLQVVAEDAFGNLTPDYTGTVTLSSSDPRAQLPPAFTFTAQDGGIHTFTVTLETPGEQLIAVNDPKIPALAGEDMVSAAVSPDLVIDLPDGAVVGSPFTVTVGTTPLGSVSLIGLTIDWGDGTQDVFSSIPPTGTATHVYLDGPDLKEVTVTAAFQEPTNSSVAEVDVSDIADVLVLVPQVNAITTGKVPSGQQATLDLPGYPGLTATLSHNQTGKSARFLIAHYAVNPETQPLTDATFYDVVVDGAGSDDVLTVQLRFPMGSVPRDLGLARLFYYDPVTGDYTPAKGSVEFSFSPDGQGVVATFTLTVNTDPSLLNLHGTVFAVVVPPTTTTTTPVTPSTVSTAPTALGSTFSTPASSGPTQTSQGSSGTSSAALALALSNSTGGLVDAPAGGSGLTQQASFQGTAALTLTLTPSQDSGLSARSSLNGGGGEDSDSGPGANALVQLLDHVFGGVSGVLQPLLNPETLRLLLGGLTKPGSQPAQGRPASARPVSVLPAEVGDPVLDALFAGFGEEGPAAVEDWVRIDGEGGVKPVGEEEGFPWLAGVLFFGLGAGEVQARYARKRQWRAHEGLSGRKGPRRQAGG